MTGPLPFEDLLDPFVAEARRELRARFVPQHSVFAESALKDLEQHLVRSVSNLLGQALELQFSLFRTLVNSNDGPSQRLYEWYVAEIAAEGLGPIWAHYPALGAALKRLTATWVDSSAEFLMRLHCDLRAIRETFHRGEELGPAVGLQTDLSDRHNAGRTVLVVRFLSGLRVVYKPRDVGVERTFYEIVRWLNSQDIPFECLVPLAIEKSGYG